MPPLDRPPWREYWPPLSYWAQVTVVVLVTAAVLLAVRSVSDILLLVLIALVLAIGLEPAVRALGRLGMGRGASAAAIFLAALLLVTLFLVLLVPPMVTQFREFADALPGYVTQLERRDDAVGDLARRYDLGVKIRDYVGRLPATVGQSLGAILGFAGTVLSQVFHLLTVGILTLYSMLAGPRILHGAALAFPPENQPQVERVVTAATARIGGYVFGNLVTSAICGAVTTVALLLLGVPYAVPLGMWAGVADLVPQVGAYLGAVPAVLVGFFQGPVKGGLVLLFFVVYQQFENYLLAPKVMQDAIDLSPAAVIVSTLVGASLAGFAGALLALPVAATLKVVVSDIWLRGRTDPAGGDPGGRGPPDRQPGGPPDQDAGGRKGRRREPR
jgi:predicted PurR-regulated permease PerM